MSDMATCIDENLKTIVEQIIQLKENIILIFAFNGTGKTRLSVEYKNVTKQKNENQHAGVYYNAYSEDLFVWDNDVDNKGNGIKLNIIPSSLNEYHSLINEDSVREKLEPYNPKFDFTFSIFPDSSMGIESVYFYSKENYKKENSIKISRGEEQAFVWCFFLALFDVNGWTEQKNSHFFIDDPVSSLDEHKIFITALTLMDLIEEHYEKRKIIITTHHVGLFSILSDWLKKGEKAESYKKNFKQYILKNDNKKIQLIRYDKDVILYHLELLQTLKKAIDEHKLYTYHFAILRQVLENISSFLGSGRTSYVLEQIGIEDDKTITSIVNTLSHKNIFRYETNEIVPDNEALLLDIFNKIQGKYNFRIHGETKNE